MKDTDDLTHKLLKLLGIARAGTKGSAASKVTSDEELVVTEGTEADDLRVAQPKYELLAMYGFSANCPNNARLELNPKTRREKGDVVFHLEEGFKVFLSWGVWKRQESDMRPRRLRHLPALSAPSRAHVRNWTGPLRPRA